MSCFFGRAGAGLATQGSSLRILGGGEEDERTNDSSDSGFLWHLSGTEREREREEGRTERDRQGRGGKRRRFRHWKILAFLTKVIFFLPP